MHIYIFSSFNACICAAASSLFACISRMRRRMHACHMRRRIHACRAFHILYRRHWALALNNATGSYMYPPPHTTCMCLPNLGPGFEQRYQLLLAGFFKLINDSVVFVGPLLLQSLVLFVENPNVEDRSVILGFLSLCLSLALSISLYLSLSLYVWRTPTSRTGPSL